MLWNVRPCILPLCLVLGLILAPVPAAAETEMGTCLVGSEVILTTAEQCVASGGEYFGPEWIPTGLAQQRTSPVASPR